MNPIFQELIGRQVVIFTVNTDADGHEIKKTLVGRLDSYDDNMIYLRHEVYGITAIQRSKIEKLQENRNGGEFR